MAICQCVGCLTHGACVGHWTPDYSAMEAIGSACKKKRWLEYCHCPCHLYDLQPVLEQPGCSMLVMSWVQGGSTLPNLLKPVRTIGSAGLIHLEFCQALPQAWSMSCVMVGKSWTTLNSSEIISEQLIRIHNNS